MFKKARETIIRADTVLTHQDNGMVELLPSMYKVLGSITSTVLQIRNQIIHKYKNFNMLLLEKMVYIFRKSVYKIQKQTTTTR